ncbi:MAG: right-handed parallel beta-helix repeat-containing protein [Candidatus Heimdallarchaeaceae archaeon]|jgi:parallel beta-helix repeat protein
MKLKQQILSAVLLISICILFVYSTENIFCHISMEESTVFLNASRRSFTNISITDDGDWLSYGFNGSGSLTDPYLIENLAIDTDESYGIFIIDTTKAFLIKNCYVSSHFGGIEIRNTTAGAVRIENCIISPFCNDGIYAFKTPNATIVYNRLESSPHTGTGIQLTGNFSTIAHNYITGYQVGISTSKGNNEVYNNTVVSAIQTGIQIGQGDNYLIYNNTSTFNEYGITLSSSSNSVIFNNSCSFNTEVGLRLHICFSCEIRYNWFEANDQFGVVLAYQSSNNIIHHNVFIDNGQESSQAFEGPTNSSVNNLWYNPVALEGNYWSNWDGKGPYDIGGTDSADLYPLSSYEGLFETDKRSAYNLFSFTILGLIVIPIVYLLRKKRN